MQSVISTLNAGGKFPVQSEVVVAVPAIHLSAAKAAIRGDIAVSAEDVGVNSGVGAFTGEISAQLLVDAGITWTLTGHSERRVGFGGGAGETSLVVAKKTQVAVKAGMSVMLCIGESLEEREAGRTMEVCISHLEPVKELLSEADWKKIVIAYEPVWAIGTGKVATPEQAEETHAQIRAWVAANISPAVARQVRIIYGGSVKANNCAQLIQCENIDGFLVGGASLLPEFVDIIKCTGRC